VFVVSRVAAQGTRLIPPAPRAGADRVIV